MEKTSDLTLMVQVWETLLAEMKMVYHLDVTWEILLVFLLVHESGTQSV